MLSHDKQYLHILKPQLKSCVLQSDDASIDTIVSMIKRTKRELQSFNCETTIKQLNDAYIKDGKFRDVQLKQSRTRHENNVRDQRELLGGWQREDRDPVSRTNVNKIHASRFESIIVGETSGKRNFHDQTQIIHESRIPHEINHAYLMK